MRKIYLSLLALVCTVGAWAQETSIADVASLSNDKVYYLKSGRGNLVYNEENPDVLCSTKAYSSISTTSDAAKWAVYNYKDNYYLYNIAGGKFVCSGTNTFPLSAEGGDPITIVENSSESHPFAFSFNGTGSIDCYNHGTAPGVAYWSDGLSGSNKDGGGTAHMIIEAGDMPEGVASIIEQKIELVPARAIVAAASDVIVGAYTKSAVSTLSAALQAYDADDGQTDANFNAIKSAYENLAESGKVTLSAGEKFRVQCFDTSRGWMAYSAVEGKAHETNVMLAGTTGNTSWAEKFPALDDAGVYADWAIIEIEGDKYIYNVEKKQCLAATSDADKVTFSDCGSIITGILPYEGQPTVFEVKFEGSDRRRLSFSPGYTADAGGVRTLADRNDNGTKFYIEKVGANVDEAVVTEMTTKISAGRSAVLDKYNAMKTLEKFSILEGSTVVGPSEFVNPQQINTDIDALASVEDTYSAKSFFVASANGVRLQNYIDNVKKYGSLANIQIEMKAEYGTLIMPCPSSVVTGLKRMTLADTDIDANGVINLENLAAGKFAKNTPYLIQAAEGSKFTIIGWDKGSKENHTTGLLTGVLNETTKVPAGSYILSKYNDKLGFYKVGADADYDAVVNRCYLTLPVVGESRFEALFFDAYTSTGINSVTESQTKQGGIYNIAGQRLGRLQKGLNIVNGKKIIVK